MGSDVREQSSQYAQYLSCDRSCDADYTVSDCHVIQHAWYLESEHSSFWGHHQVGEVGEIDTDWVGPALSDTSSHTCEAMFRNDVTDESAQILLIEPL